jgi:hypothetical protein
MKLVNPYSVFFCVLAILVSGAPVFESLAGNIDPLDLDAHYAYGENVGWLNFKPALGEGVFITDTQIMGYIWAENVGWINLSPDHGGVVNDGLGNLSGWAWGENVGWISFACHDTGSCDQAYYQVMIDPVTGIFGGYAWGENIGWVTFEALSPGIFFLETDWRDNVLPGDINDDGKIGIVDAIMGLRICAGLPAVVPAHLLADINLNRQIELAEVMYALQAAAGLRQLISHSVSSCKVPGSINFETDSEVFQVEIMGNTLWVYHIDAVYNCCIEDIEVAVTVDDYVISLLETEILEVPCDCICPYDITTRVTNLVPGVYTLRIRNHTGLLKEITGLIISGEQACTNNNECPPEAFCAKPQGACNGLGACLPRPDACITLYDPVCGCDGQTYGNACEAALSGVSVAHQGTCQ